MYPALTTPGLVDYSHSTDYPIRRLALPIPNYTGEKAYPSNSQGTTLL
jgi:hypothetical protein